MTDVHARTRRLFDELIELDTAGREMRLCDPGAEAAVTREVSSLLAAAERAGDFLGLLRPGAGSGPGMDMLAGRYQIEQHLGSGGMGDVYLARDEQLRRRVAVKLLRAAPADTDAVARFRAEARAAARLDHPNVATVYDAGETGDRQLFIVMAYYPGETLRDRIVHGPLPLTDALRIAGQVASALAAAHAAGIVHRDVKPANVLFDAEGSARLVDFGIATLLGEPDVPTPDLALGTPAYMSPEQSRGEVVDASADLWALGVMLTEMITGRRPPRGSDAGSVTDALIAIDAGVHALVSTLLCEDRTQRPASAAAVREALAALLARGGGPARARAPEAGRGALPATITRLIGRERELADARHLLGASRLLTLIGPGGTGKTRLALELASSIRDAYPDALWFVPLAEIADASLVPSAVAQALGLRDLGTVPVARSVLTALSGEHAVLLLDNVEHVLAAAPFVASLLAACPALTVLATSRAPLGVQGEQTFHVPPLALPLPGAEDAIASEAVELFVTRARAVRPSLALDQADLGVVAEICRRLDGLPLALELAAARAALLSPRAILARLEQRLDLLRADTADRPARHGTMRAVIDWSYNLLTPSERTLFSRLALFAGGASLEAVEAVARDVVTHEDVPLHVIELVSSLASKSLLQAEEQGDGEPRFAMLETMREYALDRLGHDDEERRALRAYHAYFATLAERAAERLRGPEQVEWLDRLEREYPNLRVAMETALAAPGDGLEYAARIAVSLHRLWLARGPLLEGTEVMRRILAALDAPEAHVLPPALCAQVFTAAAHLAGSRSVFVEARDLFARALALYRDLDDRGGIAATLNNLAWQVWVMGDLDGGAAISREAREIHEARGDALGVALSRNNLAWIAMERGDYDDADAHFTAVVASHERRGDARAVAYALSWHGALMERRGDLPRAAALHRRALVAMGPVSDQGYLLLVRVRLSATLHALGEPGDHHGVVERSYVPALRQFGRLWPLGFALNELGRMFLDLGEPARAEATLARALDARRASGGLGAVAESKTLQAIARMRQGDGTGASLLLRESLADARAYGSPPLLILGIEAAAELMHRAGMHERAATLLAAAGRAFDATGARRSPVAATHLARFHEELRRALGAERDDAASVAGAGLSLEAAAQLALAGAGGIIHG